MQGEVRRGHRLAAKEGRASLLLPHETNVRAWRRPMRAIESGDPPRRVPRLEERYGHSPSRDGRTGSWDGFRATRGRCSGAEVIPERQSRCRLSVERPTCTRAIGRIQHNQLDLDAAISAYGRRVELTPNDALAHLDLGDVYRAQDRLDDALAEYLIASLLDPANVRALATAAQIHASAGRDDAAVRLLRRAVTLDSAHLEARYALGRALMRLGPDGGGTARAAGVRAASAEGDAGREATLSGEPDQDRRDVEGGTRREPGR